MTIGTSVTGIRRSAFYGCRSLKSVTIPDSVTSIDESAFGNCSNLTGVTIGTSVTFIEEQAFNRCKVLTSVTVKATPPPRIGLQNTISFYACGTVEVTNPPKIKYKNIFSVHDTLYVPMESADLYKKAPHWNKFQHIIGVDFS